MTWKSVRIGLKQVEATELCLVLIYSLQRRGLNVFSRRPPGLASHLHIHRIKHPMAMQCTIDCPKSVSHKYCWLVNSSLLSNGHQPVAQCSPSPPTFRPVIDRKNNQIISLINKPENKKTYLTLFDLTFKVRFSHFFS